ncbi:hypothetical protein [Pseudomonas syringae]|uniref:hypothetical protein n=1 Tax=Pseudomonas syringae TaxID=317 RepID=UPI001F2900DE|nr:hypothetical protein [Pseudomonas syringae]MCF5371933.1 hypothetical protein [Pseudomonas syringae]MCF5382509.1 hypothetical protein [Pseudomonas syringae]MCF5419396.1 hypothetical protein [Pseudomonas syringae]MCF5451943.1 hypothetical protein [Pseudomonas syringae]MCF5458727.1 hypothetical protein [Pseudomonas syringae]
MTTPQHAMALQGNVTRSLEMLRHAGYQCAQEGAASVVVQDPVLALAAGNSVKTEHKPVGLNVADGLGHVIYFIRQRS